MFALNRVEIISKIEGFKAGTNEFDRKGNHLGKADPLTREIKLHSDDFQKKLSKEYR